MRSGITQDASGPFAGSMSTVGPRLALVGADGGDDVLAGLAFDAFAGGEHAEAVSVPGDDDVGLIAVAFAPDDGAVLDVAPVGRGGGGGSGVYYRRFAGGAVPAWR